MTAVYVPDLLIKLQTPLAANSSDITLSPAEQALFHDATGNSQNVETPMVLCDDVRRESVNLKFNGTAFILDRFRDKKYPFPAGSVLKPVLTPALLTEFITQNNNSINITALQQIAKEVSDAKTAIDNTVAGLNTAAGNAIDAYLLAHPIDQTKLRNIGTGEGSVFDKVTGGFSRIRRLKEGTGINIETSGDNVIISREAVTAELPKILAASNGVDPANTVGMAFGQDPAKNAVVVKSLWFDPAQFTVVDLNGTVQVQQKKSPLSFGKEGRFTTTVPFSDDVSYNYNANKFSSGDVVMLTVMGDLGTVPVNTIFRFFWKLADGSVKNIGFDITGKFGTVMTTKPADATELRLQVVGQNLPTTVTTLPVISYFTLTPGTA